MITILKLLPSKTWNKFVKITDTNIKEIDSLISKKNINKPIVIVGRPTPIVPFTTPPKKKIIKIIKYKLLTLKKILSINY